MSFLPLLDSIVLSQSASHSVLEGNEAQTRWLLIDPLLFDGFGFNRNDIIVEYSLDSITRINKYNKLDYCILINNKPRILIEAKSLGINLFDKRDQLASYFDEVLRNSCFVKNELLGILTNGDTYLFFTNSTDISKMDSSPFCSIQLSISEDLDRLNLLRFHKDSLLSNPTLNLSSSSEFYELSEFYRIDVIENVLTFFQSNHIDVAIKDIILCGMRVNITTLSGLYRHLLKDVNMLNSNLLFNLCLTEDNSKHGKIINSKFSLRPINSSNLTISTARGVVYVSIPTTTKGLIERILYLVNISCYGVHNIMVSFKEKKS